MKSGAEDALPKRDKPADHASAGEANQRLERIIPGGPWPSGHRQAFIPLPLLAMGLLIPFHPFDTNSFPSPFNFILYKTTQLLNSHNYTKFIRSSDGYLFLCYALGRYRLPATVLRHHCPLYMYCEIDSRTSIASPSKTPLF